MKAKQSPKSLQYQALRKANSAKLAERIRRDYDRLKKKNIDKGVIIGTLMAKYGVSHATIYNHVDVKKYKRKAIRATLGSDPLRRA